MIAIVFLCEVLPKIPKKSKKEAKILSLISYELVAVGGKLMLILYFFLCFLDCFNAQIELPLSS